MSINDLTDPIMDHLYDLLESNRQNISDALSAKGYPGDFARIWRDDQHVIDAYPCIVLVAVGKNVKWSATRTRDEKYTFNVDVLSKVAKREEAARYIRCFGAAVQNVLNDFDNLRWTITGTRILAFDSFANDLVYGFKQEGALRVARISWFCETTNPVSN